MFQIDDKIGFIGVGNMAEALIKGLIKSGLYSPDRIASSDNDTLKLKNKSETYGIRACYSNRELVQASSIIVLSVKPQVIKAVLSEIAGYLEPDQLVISIAAGITINLIQDAIGKDKPIIRVMPNTPALIQRGISALSGGGTAAREHMNKAQEIFNAVGKTVIVDEGMMDAITAISGSGPGFVFRIMESFVEAGERLGFDRDTALMLVKQTFLGASHLADESESSLSKLREMVTSPGGTTAAGLSAFEDRGLSEVISYGLKAARDRSVELGKK
ncbi:MAG: pyrroline-5-carboxylate reductase [Deltaproteobacteria bacterium]|nr:pyrroline-5-carboxylate reductase [Deltaproteobacteria bacterium]